VNALFIALGLIGWLATVLFIAAVCSMSDEKPVLPRHRPKSNVTMVHRNRDEAA
jgi:hypothetical protein